jgi:hypothetical protein
VTKRCGKCGHEKPLEEFHRRRNGWQTWCKPCRREYDCEYHRTTRPTRLAQAKRRQTAFFAWYAALKEGKPCADCGRTFHPVAMQWDHRPGTTKTADLSRLRSTTSKRRVLDEIAKCDLVCANCHAVRTFTRGRGVAQPG